MLIVDAHAHMDSEKFSHDLKEVLTSCKEKGIVSIVSNGTTTESNRRVLELAKEFPIIKAALGVYPTEVLTMTSEEFSSELQFIEQQLQSKKAIAIGEVGLEFKEVTDFTEEKKTKMMNALRSFCTLAKKYNVPIILHTRGAERETIELLEQEGMQKKKVIMHCFCGRKNHVKQIKENGWSCSIPCSITRSQQFEMIVDMLPLEQLFTETDAPYLGPVAGERNDARNITFTINKIAQIKKLEALEVSQMLYNNYQRIFL